MSYINLHTHQYTKRQEVLEIVNQYPAEWDASIPFYSIGIHPWYINEQRIDEDLEVIKSKLTAANCLAIGECGLDKRIDIPFDLQINVFEKQLLLAEQFRKPVIVHCVAAFQELMEIVGRLHISVPVIIHGFSKNAVTAEQLVRKGFYLSFGKYLLRNPELEAAFTAVPDHRFFLETDTIEEGIEQVYEQAAKYRECSTEQLMEQLRQNYETTFGKYPINIIV